MTWPEYAFVIALCVTVLALTARFAVPRMPFALAIAFWAWSAFITFGAGFLGAGLNCEYGCQGDWQGRPPQWAKPWTLGDHYVFPEVFFVAVGGLAFASAFSMLVRQRRSLAAAGAFLISALLLSYPFFAGLTYEGRKLFFIGPLAGVAALWALRAENAPASSEIEGAENQRL